MLIIYLTLAINVGTYVVYRCDWYIDTFRQCCIVRPIINVKWDKDSHRCQSFRRARNTLSRDISVLCYVCNFMYLYREFKNLWISFFLYYSPQHRFSKHFVTLKLYKRHYYSLTLSWFAELSFVCEMNELCLREHIQLLSLFNWCFTTRDQSN